MKNIKNLIVILFSFNCLLITTSLNAALGPGYVSRDCPIAGAKESITVDWSERKHWFQTHSKHAFTYKNATPTTEKDVYWLTYTSDPKPGARGGWDETWRSHAGGYLEYARNYSYTRVVGYHFWFNVNSRVIERRMSDVQDCNLDVWGSGNWKDEDTMKANWPSIRNAFSVLLTFF